MTPSSDLLLDRISDLMLAAQVNILEYGQLPPVVIFRDPSPAMAIPLNNTPRIVWPVALQQVAQSKAFVEVIFTGTARLMNVAVKEIHEKKLSSFADEERDETQGIIVLGKRGTEIMGAICPYTLIPRNLDVGEDIPVPYCTDVEVTLEEVHWILDYKNLIGLNMFEKVSLAKDESDETVTAH